MLRTWFTVNSVVAGVLALVWLVLRTGPKPSRFAYPCQQAAFSAASLAFGAPLVATLVAARRGLVQGMRTPAGVAAAMVGLLATVGIWGHSSLADDPATRMPWRRRRLPGPGLPGHRVPAGSGRRSIPRARQPAHPHGLAGD